MSLGWTLRAPRARDKTWIAKVSKAFSDAGLRDASDSVVVAFAPDAPMLTYLFEWSHDLPGDPTRAETVESWSLQVLRHLRLQ
eukprot:2990133-Pyramimonas_sp.AAC.1